MYKISGFCAGILYAYPSNGAKRRVSPEECTDQPTWMTFSRTLQQRTKGRAVWILSPVDGPSVPDCPGLEAHPCRDISRLAAALLRPQKRPQSLPLRDFGPSPVSKTFPNDVATGLLVHVANNNGMFSSLSWTQASCGEEPYGRRQDSINGMVSYKSHLYRESAFRQGGLCTNLTENADFGH